MASGAAAVVGAGATCVLAVVAGVSSRCLARCQTVQAWDLAAATQDCQESSTLSHQTGYVRGEAQAERDACHYLVEQQLWSPAVEHGRQALALFRKVGDRHGEATTLAYLAQALLHDATTESQQEAQDYQRAAERLQQQHRWPSVAQLLARLPGVE